MTSPTPTSEDTTSRPRLPWQIVAAVTVFAALVAAGVALVLSGDGDGADVTASAPGGTTLELTPSEEVDADDDVMEIAYTRPDGSEVSLAETVDGPTVVNFFASWCPPCIREMPDFEAVFQEVGGEVAFLGLAVQDRPEDAERIVDQTGVTYDWGRDIRGDIAGAAGVVQMPTTMFLDGDGTIVHIQAGAVDQDRLRSLIDEHLGASA